MMTVYFTIAGAQFRFGTDFMKKKIVLDVRGRGFSDDLIEMVMKNIHLRCDSVYLDIPIEVLAY